MEKKTLPVMAIAEPAAAAGLAGPPLDAALAITGVAGPHQRLAAGLRLDERPRGHAPDDGGRAHQADSIDGRPDPGPPPERHGSTIGSVILGAQRVTAAGLEATCLVLLIRPVQFRLQTA